MSNLCESCAELNLKPQDFSDSQTRTKGNDKVVIKEQLLSVLKSNVTCSLCQLITFAVEDTRSAWEQDRSADDAVRCFVRLMPNRFPTPKPFKVLDVHTQFPFYGPSYGIQLLPVGPSDLEGPLVGRIFDPSKLSLTLVKSWMQSCVEGHGEACGLSRSPRFNEIEELLLVIDVEKDCIVHPVEEFRYLALSYVWGKVDSVKLLKENFADLQEPSGVAKIFERLARTIQDAITLTKELGERYLWIDSLCIIQDDAAFKAKIINKMNLVYENAFATIVAASGLDANAGLPGIRETKRTVPQPLADFSSDLRFIYARSHQSLAKSKWATRGWTYQEYYFSKRRLIFHHGMVFFHCRKRSWREDVALEKFDEDTLQFDMHKGFDAATELWEPALQQDQSDFWDTYRSYWGSVRAYKERELTYASDALNAFAGIVNYIQVDRDLETFCGLPLSTFVADLFWQPDIFGTWREDFPTWSWVGWSGGLASQNDNEEHRILSSWISVFRLKAIDAESTQYIPLNKSKDVPDVPDVAGEGSRESIEELEQRTKSAIGALEKLVAAQERVSKDSGKYCDLPEVRETIRDLKAAAHTRFDVTQTLAAYSLDLSLKSRAIYFRALTAEVWISACAPNGEVVMLRQRMSRFPDAHFRPTLYAYSTAEPTLKPLGLTWIQNMSYLNILEQTKKVAPSKIQTDMKPGITGPLIARGDPSKFFFKKHNEESSQEPTPLTEAQQKRAREIEQGLRAFAEEHRYPYDSVATLPNDPQEREEILRSRRIVKLRIAIISGPVTGNGGGRMGVPFGYPNQGRRFFRAIVVGDSFIKHPKYTDRVMCFSKRIGICALEINALPLLEDVRFEDILLV